MRVAFSQYDEMKPLSELKRSRHQRNKHPKEQIERLALIMREHGVRHPISISKRSGEVCFGHGRWEAARLNKWTEFPVVYQDFASEEEEYSCVQSDNAIAHWAELDLSAINADLPGLGPDFDIDLLGIEGLTLDAPFEAQADEDAVPEHVEPNAKLGDIYVLGRHRLMCGDCTDVDALDSVMDGKRADICFTSPPYNLGDNIGLRSGAFSGRKNAYNVHQDHQSDDSYIQLLTDFLSLAMTASSVQLINLQMLANNKVALIEWLNRFKDNFADVMIWSKTTSQPAMAENVLNSAFEFIFIFDSQAKPKRSIRTANFNRGELSNVYTSSSGNNHHTEGTHGATFPVALAEHYIANFCPDNGSILEPFCGSGTTLIACEKNNRTCFMLELDPHYIDVIIARWEKYTGMKAELIQRNEDEPGQTEEEH
jgi:DNA modification methylase